MGDCLIALTDKMRAIYFPVLFPDFKWWLGGQALDITKILSAHKFSRGKTRQVLETWRVLVQQLLGRLIIPWQNPGTARRPFL